MPTPTPMLLSPVTQGPRGPAGDATDILPENNDWTGRQDYTPAGGVAHRIVPVGDGTIWSQHRTETANHDGTVNHVVQYGHNIGPAGRIDTNFGAVWTSVEGSWRPDEFTHWNEYHLGVHKRDGRVVRVFSFASNEDGDRIDGYMSLQEFQFRTSDSSWTLWGMLAPGSLQLWDATDGGQCGLSVDRVGGRDRTTIYANQDLYAVVDYAAGARAVMPGYTLNLDGGNANGLFVITTPVVAGSVRFEADGPQLRKSTLLAGYLEVVATPGADDFTGFRAGTVRGDTAVVAAKLVLNDPTGPVFRANGGRIEAVNNGQTDYYDIACKNLTTVSGNLVSNGNVQYGGSSGPRLRAGAGGIEIVTPAQDDWMALTVKALTVNGLLTLSSKPAVSGSRGGNAALASLLTGLASLNLITDSTSA